MSLPDLLGRFFQVQYDEDTKEGYEVENGEEAPQNRLDRVESFSEENYSDRNTFVGQPAKNMNKNPSNNNVIGLRGLNNNNAEVMVIEPQSFDDMPQVIDALRDRKSVVLNLEKMDAEKAQRSVDFVAGGTYAMDGHFERVGDNIFLFTPSCVSVSNLSGLITGADDFSSARNRRPGNSTISHPLNDRVDPWTESATAAQ